MKAHAGVEDIKNKKCEGCGLKHPSFGLPAEGKKQWCSGCAKVHTGAVNIRYLINNKKYEGCLLKQPSFGLPAEEKKR